MKLLLLLLSLCLVACGTDGKDGAAGPTGPAGAAGKDGANGADGKDGTDNKAVAYKGCTYTITAGALSGTSVVYTLITLASGDKLVTLETVGLGAFNASTTQYYPSQQSGATNEYVALVVDNANTLKAQKSGDQVSLTVVVSGTPEPSYLTTNCTTQTF